MRKLGLDDIEGSDRIAKWYLRFSEQSLGSEMYQYLAKEVAEDSELIALSALADPKQPVPNLLFSAVNFLLYKNPGHPLARFYPNHSGNRFSVEGFFPEFKKFCIGHHNEIEKIIKSRLVQTNEVRRCALLMPAVLEVGKRTQQELALIDVGTSSGLNLLMNQYFYMYSDGTSVGDPTSKLTLSCENRESRLRVNQLPKIQLRIGIDLNPIDLQKPDEKLWALSLIWPDQVERVERLKSAIQILSQNELEIHQGDAMVVLPQVAEKIPKSTSICVMHSFVLNQFPVEAREAFNNILCRLSQTRDIWRISLEWLGTEFPQLELHHYAAGDFVTKELLATCHHHGEWIRWN